MSDMEKAKAILEKIPSDSDMSTILATLWSHHQSQESAELNRRALQQQLPKPKWDSDLGCLIPVVLVGAMFLAMPVMFNLGERIIGGRPVRPLNQGTIVEIGVGSSIISTAEFLNRECKIYPAYVEIEGGETTTYIPTEKIVVLRISPKR